MTSWLCFAALCLCALQVAHSLDKPCRVAKSKFRYYKWVETCVRVVSVLHSYKSINAVKSTLMYTAGSSPRILTSPFSFPSLPFPLPFLPPVPPPLPPSFLVSQPSLSMASTPLCPSPTLTLTRLTCQPAIPGRVWTGSITSQPPAISTFHSVSYQWPMYCVLYN